MTPRSTRLVTLPTGVTLLGLLALQTTHPASLSFRRMGDPGAGDRERAVSRPALPSELPKLVAVDARIARRVNALRPGVKVKLLRAVSRLPKNVTLVVTSAARTRAEQASLKATYGVKAKPGRSPHEDGRAVDVNVLVDGERIRTRAQNKIIGWAMRASGFHYLGAMDPVHYSVPREKVGKPETSPDLEVMTVGQMDELKAEIAEAKLNGTFLAASASPTPSAAAEAASTAASFAISP
jgi:hypothetical protein